MNRNNKYILLICSILFSFLSITINLIFKDYSRTYIDTNDVYVLVDSITRYYQIKQVLASTLIYIVGYCVSFCIIKEKNALVIAVWALPISVVLWCVSSITLLLINIPYNALSGLISFLVLSFLTCFRNIYRIKELNILNFITIIFFVIGIEIFISSGIPLFPIYMSPDSYYCVMQYGQVIAKTGELSFETAGTPLTNTGTSYALLSSFSTLFGFESIAIFHWGLIVSLILCIFLEFNHIINSENERKNKLYALLFTTIMVLMPPFLYMSSWLISNTYSMVMVFFLMIGIKHYSDLDDYRNDNFLILLSLMLICIGMGRAEMPVCIAGIVLISCILKLSKKEMLVLSIPLAMYETLFLMKTLIQQRISTKTVSDSFYPLWVVAILLVAVWGAVFFSVLINTNILRWIKKHLVGIAYIIFPIFWVSTSLLNFEKFVLNIKTLIYNLTYEFWTTVPLFFIFLTILYIWKIRKSSYYLIFSYVYFFANMILCFGRQWPLRNGAGDSLNRILMSFIPIIYFALMEGIYNYYRNKS